MAKKKSKKSGIKSIPAIKAITPVARNKNDKKEQDRV